MNSSFAILRQWCRLAISRLLTPKNRIMPYVFSLLAMKLTIMMLLATKHTQLQPKTIISSNSLSIESSPVSVKISTEDELRNQQYWKMLENIEETEIEATATNRTKPSSIWLIYNRVPRSGGLTMVYLIKELTKANHFTHQQHQYRTPWQRLLVEDEMKNLVTWFEYQHQAKSYDRHLLYVNFTRFQRYAKNLHPIYINMIRDPAEREYSAFRARRGQDPLETTHEIKKRDAIKAGSGMEWYTKSFSDCVMDQEDPECWFNTTENAFSRSIPYFCGQDTRCLEPGSKWALQRAKFIIEHEFSVVGILNKMNETIQVLENYLPRFFAGASKIFYGKGYGRRHENRYIKSKPDLSGPVLTRLRDELANEYDLYEFCQQRLYHQYQQTVNKH